MRKKVKYSFAIAFIILSNRFLVSAQELQLIDSTSIPTPEKVSIDRLGNIYIVDITGDINRYDNKGNLNLQYSPQQLAEISLIESWNPLKIFIFYRDFQEYLFLDRFLTTTSRFSTTEFGSYIGLSTISADNNIWAIDYSDFTLKKYDVTLNQLILSTPLNMILDQQEYDIRFMREYQNLLFISDYHSGLLVFDNLGNYLRKLDLKGVDYFNFNENEVYYCKKNQVTYANIYNSDTKNYTFKEDLKFILSRNKELITVTNTELKRYKILQKK